MAHTPYTGKSSTAVFGVYTIPGVRRIVIEENAGPLPEQLDKTVAADSAYSTMQDPLGAKGSAKTSITIEGLASRRDVEDTGLFSLGLDTAGATANLVITKSAGANKFTLTNAVLKRRALPAEIATLVPYTCVFELESTGAWAAA